MDAGFYLILGLVGSGYLFSKDGKNERQSDENIPSSIEPSGNNIYDSNHLKKVENFVQDKADNRFEKSLDPSASNVIPQFYNLQPSSKKTKTKPKSKKPVLAADGKPFTHSNMTPFYSGSLKQNTNFDINHSLIENFTGVIPKPQKKELKPMFNAVKQNVHGMENENEMRNLDRMYVSKIQRGSTNIERTHVGKGLNIKSNQTNTGGFHDMYRPPQKNVDELRVKGKERLEYKGRMLEGKGINQKRTMIGDVSVHNKADVNEQLIKDLAKTTGDLFRPANRPNPLLHETQQLPTESIGGANAPHTKFNDQHDIFENGLSKEAKPELVNDGVRNAHYGVNGDNRNNDISSFDVHDNQRNLSNNVDFSHNINNLSKGELRVQDELRSKKMNCINDYVGLSNPGSKDGYQNLNFDLNETNRETTSINYTPSAKSFLNKDTDIFQYNNMNTNNKRECISKNREPKGSSTKFVNTSINYEPRKFESDASINVNDLNHFIKSNKSLNRTINNTKCPTFSKENSRLEDLREKNPLAINLN